MKTWLLATVLIMAPPVWAQSGGIFEITRSTLDGGGSTERSSENLVLRGTIGQPDVGSLGQGAYSLSGGFWPSLSQAGVLFLDGFESGDTSAWSTSVGELPAAPAQAYVEPQSEGGGELTELPQEADRESLR